MPFHVLSLHVSLPWIKAGVPFALTLRRTLSFLGTSREKPNGTRSTHVAPRVHDTALGSDGQGPQRFSFGFLDLFDFFDLFAELARACWVSWSVRRGRARSCEYVWIAQSHSGRSSSLDARGPGPDLTWQRTLAVVVCVALEGVFKGRK